MCKTGKTPLNNDTSSIIKLPTSLIQDANKTSDGLHYHQQEHPRLHWDQGPSKTSLQVKNAVSGIHGLSRPLKSSNNKDHEKRRLITQHIALILHSHHCSFRDKGSVKNCGNVQTECPFPHCGTMKDVLVHLTSCKLLGKFCPFPHCSSSRQIILHWRSCIKSYCPICMALRRPDIR